MAHFRLLTVLFPMWNEQAYIKRAVRAAGEICEDLVKEDEISDFEILIVDDASTDRTAELAREMQNNDPRVRLVQNKVNRKLGGTLKSGLANARGDLILYTDADLPFDLAELRKACRLMRIYDADVVSAYRHDRTTEGPKRTLISYAYNWFIRYTFRTHVRDVNFAGKLFRTRIFRHINLASEGSFIDAELIIRASRLGYRVVQFGVDYFPRASGVSTLSSTSVIRRILREAMSLRRELKAIRPLPPDVVALPPLDEGIPNQLIPDTHHPGSDDPPEPIPIHVRSARSRTKGAKAPTKTSG